MKSLYHFSENGGIRRFEPRPVLVPAQRGPGMDWLNGPLVWSIDDEHSPLYLFPRDCPRIVMWPLPSSTDADIATYWNDPSKRMVAFFEERWLDTIKTTRLFRYELPSEHFVDLQDAGMHVSDCSVAPVAVQPFDNLLASLRAAGVDIRPLPDLRSLKGAWTTSLHVSGIRLRNARNWR